MKKFLSLLLALVMTMSLVTISAGATEYKDLTDKDELGPQYQEAVAVLNKIGVITGYDDGSFRPDVELTRGAAAKIIVSLMIGPEAANNLPNNSAPYPDVPASHTFAGVISFCKTAGIINGYGDGTFKPANALTGYAFAKMLLSALGYDNDMEGFVGTGWTNNVLKIGQEASLFDRLDFKGSDAVTRKDAALLALNTLKATVVEYNNPQTITVTGENTNVVVNGGQVRSYKTSNQDYARNILPQRRDIANTTTSRADYNTVEFAEEHFVDLRLPHDKYDPIDNEYGRPSAEWTYKKLSIGKFPLVPDFEYTSQVAHNIVTVTDASKVRALGLNGYTVSRNTIPAGSNAGFNTRLWINGYFAGTLAEVADIADLTDNGTLVEVYVDNNGADFITDVVVIKSQLMEVKKIGADYVALDTLDADDPGTADSDHAVLNVLQHSIYGFNQEPIELKINNVEVGDEYYEFLSGLKVEDKVVVEPVSADHGNTSWDVGHAYAPETVTGTLNGVPDRFGDTNNNYNSLSVDVGGTTYKVSLWNNKDLAAISPDAIKVTKKDVTLTLDRYGYAMSAKDVGSITGWLIVKNYRQSIENGILVTFVNGWDLDGKEVSLNIGARAGVTNWNLLGTSNDVWDTSALPRVGSLVKYESSITSNTADWDLYQTNAKGVYNVFHGADENNTNPYYIRANSSAITVENALIPNRLALREDVYSGTTDTILMAKDIKFIYVTFDDSGELDTIEIKSGRTKVENSELVSNLIQNSTQGHGRAQAAVEWDRIKDKEVQDEASVKAVIIKQANSDASFKNLLYIVSNEGDSMRDDNGQMVQKYKVAMMDADGKVTITDIHAYRTTLQVGEFARYTKSEHDKYPDDFYTLRKYVGEKGRTAATWTENALVSSFKSGNNNLVTISALSAAPSIFNIGDTCAEDRNIFSGTWGEENKDSFADWMLDMRTSAWVDLTGNNIDSVSDLKDACKEHDVRVNLLFNDDPDSDYFRTAYLVVVTSVTAKGAADQVSGPWYTAPVYDDVMGGVTTTITIDAADWAAAGSDANMLVTPVVNGIPESLYGATVHLKRNGDKLTATYRFFTGFTSDSFKQSAISFVKGTEVYESVKVRYWNGPVADEKEITNSAKLVDETTAVSSIIPGTTLGFKWTTTDGSNSISVAVSGVDPSFTTVTGLTGSDGKITYSGGPIKAVGTSYVDVLLGGLSDLVETYDVKAVDSQDALDDTGLQINSVSGGEGIRDAVKLQFTPVTDAVLDTETETSRNVIFSLTTLDSANGDPSFDVTIKVTGAKADKTVLSFVASRGGQSITGGIKEVPVRLSDITGDVTVEVVKVEQKKNVVFNTDQTPKVELAAGNTVFSAGDWITVEVPEGTYVEKHLISVAKGGGSSNPDIAIETLRPGVLGFKVKVLPDDGQTMTITLGIGSLGTPIPAGAAPGSKPTEYNTTAYKITCKYVSTSGLSNWEVAEITA